MRVHECVCFRLIITVSDLQIIKQHLCRSIIFLRNPWGQTFHNFMYFFCLFENGYVSHSFIVVCLIILRDHILIIFVSPEYGAWCIIGS